MNKLILIFLLFLTNVAFCQKIKTQFIEKVDSLNKKERYDFFYLNENLDLSKAKYIGKVKCTSKIPILSFMVDDIKYYAQKKGANAFVYDNFSKNDTTLELVLKVYVIDEALKKEVVENLPKNNIYIFGRDDFNQPNKLDEYRLNNETKTIKSGKYSVVHMNINEKYSINKGGTLGSTFTISGKENKDSIFINFQGFGTNGIVNNNGGLGMSFSAGKVIPFDSNYGLLFLKIFEEQK